MTLVERQTRRPSLAKLANKQAETINRAVKSLLSQYPILLYHMGTMAHRVQ